MKIRTPPSGPSKNGAPQAPPLSQWNPRDQLTILVQHRGGPESWWQIKARGRVWRFPGHLCIDDVLTAIADGRGGRRE